MKRLIGPILIGLVMFGAAFGGAFFLYRHQEAKAAEHVKQAVAESLAALNQGGTVTVFAGRFVAMVPPGPVGADPSDAPPKPALIVPGTVRYEIDLKAVKDRDVVWHEGEALLSVKLPPLAVTAPRIDAGETRRHDGGGAWTVLSDGDTVLDEVARATANADLMKQAREAAGPAREAARALVRRGFAMALRAAAVKAGVEVRFADEAAANEEGGGDGAGREG